MGEPAVSTLPATTLHLEATHVPNAHRVEQVVVSEQLPVGVTNELHGFFPFRSGSAHFSVLRKLLSSGSTSTAFSGVISAALGA